MRVPLAEDELRDTPDGTVTTLTVSAPVSVDDLLAGDIFVALDLETYHSPDGTTRNTGTDWTADQFQATYDAGDVVCESEVVKTSDVTEVSPGDVVTYTVEATNVGNGIYTTSFTDDLSGVLDDATYNDDVSASLGTATVTGSTLEWSGTLQPGEVATVTYSVTVDVPPMGDGVLDNVILGGQCPDPAITDPEDPDYDPNCHNTVIVLFPELEATKSADVDEAGPGDTVTYTITLTNTGDGDFTENNPATFLDDLSGVLDDATYNDDATADDGSTVSFQEPLLSWTGPIPAGDTVTITYTVTANEADDLGDELLENVLLGGQCPDPATTDPEDPDYDPNCHNTVAVLVPELTAVKSVDMTEAGPGDVVAYTITLTNTGNGDFTYDQPAVVYDDLWGVLDDAVYNGDAAASDGSTVEVENEFLSWWGPLAADETVTITYTVTVNDPMSGDGSLHNYLITPSGNCPEGSEDPDCETSTPITEPAPPMAPPSPITPFVVPVTD